MCALEPTAIAEAPMITFGAYSADNTVRLSWPNIDSVIPNSSCIVPQCSTSAAAVTAADSPNSASTPADAARTDPASQFGSGDAASTRRPTLVLTPITAPIPCTARTLRKARPALGVWSWVSTDAASWMTASASAAISSGPPIAEATTQRTTNHEARFAVARGGTGGAPDHQEGRQQRHDAELAAPIEMGT